VAPYCTLNSHELEFQTIVGFHLSLNFGNKRSPSSFGSGKGSMILSHEIKIKSYKDGGLSVWLWLKALVPSLKVLSNGFLERGCGFAEL